MPNPLKFRAKPIIIADDARGRAVGVALEAILNQLICIGSPFVEPSQIAPRLGVTPGAFRYHCRNCGALKNWQGQYRFMLDDAEHLDALKSVLRLALWSMKSVPHYAATPVH